MYPSDIGDFGRFPGEIRNMLYNFIFYHPDGIAIDFTTPNTSLLPRHISGLIKTCRAITQECEVLPFVLNDFYFNVPLLQQDCRGGKLPPVRRAATSWVNHDYMQGRDAEPLVPSSTTFLVALREQERLFITRAVRGTHAFHLVANLEKAVTQENRIRLMRKVVVQLGKQTKTSLALEFEHCWDMVMQVLRKIKNMTQLAVAFRLCLSRRLVVDFQFDIGTLEETMSAIDGHISQSDLHLPELSFLHIVKSKVRATFFTPRSEAILRLA